MKIFNVIGVVVFSVLQAGCSTTSPVHASKAADLAAIEAFNRHYLQAINSGDSAALARLTTANHIMLPPNSPPIVGKTANDAAMKRAFEMFDIKESWTPVETQVAGDWAYQRGTYSVTATPRNNGISRTSTGNFLRIYRRQADGSWVLTRDMFNSGQPPAAD